MTTPLAAQLAREIRDHGPITFERFMDAALYEPGMGYYRSARDPFGKEGDYFTAEQLQPVFGELMASFVERLAAEHGAGRGSFPVVEVGAGREEMREALAEWNYVAVEIDRGALSGAMRGVILANEFFDALPVRLLRRQGSGWEELRVGVRDGRFSFVPCGLAEGGSEEEAEAVRQMLEYAERYGGAIGEGGRLEVSVRTKPWVDRLAASLESGYLVAIDYGYGAKELARHEQGTAVSYRRHQTVEDVLSRPGEQDITTHVNFTYLTEAAVHAGFRQRSRQTLGAWAMSVWDERELSRRWEGAAPRWRLQWKQIVFGMGETFQVAVFEKGG